VQGRYHPVMQAKLVGGLDASNNLVGLHIRLSGQSILKEVRPAIVEQQKGRDPLVFQGLADSGEHSFGYTIPNLLIDHAMRQNHVPPGVWRGVNVNQNCIFIECFMDELAQAAGQDELEFRLKNMASLPRHQAVLKAVAERIGWGKPARSGIHRGLAQMKSFNSFVAAAAEISVQGGNKVKIHRIVAATDPGYAVNPAQIERQVSGSFVYGLSGAFMQGCTVQDGRIVENNFHTYPSMRIAQMPKVETIIMASGGTIWGGIGEPTICVAAPAVMNAFFKATGRRIREVPLKKHGIELV
jgi:isoquinoline 1-oxidoreductase beta subunit